MTDEEQIRAIAEVCPHVCHKSLDGNSGYRWNQGTTWGYAIFDPLSDLNAIHEAEEAMYYQDLLWHRRYAREIHKIVVRDWNARGDGETSDDPKESGWFAWYLGTHATARQRAEAFLRTLNLWKE